MVFQQDPRQTGMIYERALESGWFDDFLEHWSNPLALDMACMRNKLDSEFDLDRYLSDIADGSRHAQLGVILGKYVRIKANDEFRVQREHSPPQSVPLNLATVHTSVGEARGSHGGSENSRRRADYMSDDVSSLDELRL